MSRSARLDAPGVLAETGTFVTSDVKALPAGIWVTVLPFESVTTPLPTGVVYAINRSEKIANKRNYQLPK